MGILDTRHAAAGQNDAQADDSAGNPREALVQGVLSMLVHGNEPGGLGGMGGMGGLDGLLQRFQNAGMGDAVASWIGGGPRLPISADQIRAALGGGPLRTLAEGAGLSEDETALHLSTLLPQIVDKLTPDGQLPAEGVHQGGVAGAMEMLGGLFGKD